MVFKSPGGVTLLELTACWGCKEQQSSSLPIMNIISKSLSFKCLFSHNLVKINVKPCCYHQLMANQSVLQNLAQSQNNQLNQIRCSTSFFVRREYCIPRRTRCLINWILVTADELWKGVTSVSKAGKRRGRGKGAGKRQAKDLNKGQIIGVGQVNMVWPGLNSPVLRGREMVDIKKLPQEKNYIINLLRVRNEMDTYRKKTIHPLERGWSGKQLRGRWIGPPDPILDETFPGFDSKVLMVKNESIMTAREGRTRYVVTMAVTGNKKGIAGFAFVKTKEAGVAVRRAKNKAAQRLIYVDLYENHTIMHDFVSTFKGVKIYAFKKPPGFGIVAHRCIKACCECLGIKDIYCKVEGEPTNYLAICKAFFTGLVNQKTFQQMADEKRLHVVELKPQNDYYPRVMASPSPGLKVRTGAQIGADEITDFRMYLNDGKVIDVKPKAYPNHVRTAGYIKMLHSEYFYVRNRQNVRVYLKAKYGQLDSFLTVAEKKERHERKVAMALLESGPSSEAAADDVSADTSV